jgi:putative transposase
LSTRAETELVLATLEKAYQKEKVAGELLLHSDQGAQYTSLAYQGLSQAYGIPFRCQDEEIATITQS